jgi:hypothetical protein
MNFQGTKTSNMNSPNQIEQFDINIIHFGGLNSCQRRVSFLSSESSDVSLSLSLSSPNQGPKTKMRFSTKIELEKC